MMIGLEATSQMQSYKIDKKRKHF